MLADILPKIDKLALSICYGNYSEFEYFMKFVEFTTGQNMKHHPSGAHEYCPYRIFFEPPQFNRRMYGIIHLCPTQTSLNLLQNWLKSFFKSMYYCKGIITLSSMELAYDLPITHKNYDLLSRLSYRIIPKYGKNLYSTICKSENDKVCKDGAINGLITHYIQSTTTQYAHLSSESLDRNYNASKHYKLYIKEIPPDIFLRIELTLKKSTLSAKFTLDKDNLGDILEQTKNYPLSHFLSLKEVNYSKFIQTLCKHDEVGKLKNKVWKHRIAEAANMPSADKIRIMREAAKTIKMKNPNIHRYTKEMTIAEAANMPLPEGWHISNRSPDAEIRGERARRRIKISKPDMPQNGAESGRSEAQGENAIINMRRTKLPQKRP